MGQDGSGGEDNSYRTGFGDRIASVVCTSGPDGTGDGDRPPLSGPDSPGDPGEETDLNRTGFGEQIVGFIYKSGPVGPCNEDSSPSSGSDTPLHQFVCVYHPESSGPSNELYKRADANAPGDVIVMPGESWELHLETFDKPYVYHIHIFGSNYCPKDLCRGPH